MVTWSTWTPRSVSSSSTSRYDNANRRYQRTASTITSGGKQKPAKADRGMVAGRGRGVLMTTACPLGARSQQMQQRRRDPLGGAVANSSTAALKKEAALPADLAHPGIGN